MKNLFYFIGAVLICVILFCSCNAYRAARQQKKVDNAVNTVLSNNDAREQIFQIQLGLHPVSGIPILIKGKDSIVYLYDTLRVVEWVKDSTIKVNYPSLNLDSLRKANTFYVKEYHYRVDTLPVLDTLYQRKYEYASSSLNVAIGTVTQLNKELSATKKESKNRLWLIIGISLFASGLTYLLFKK